MARAKPSGSPHPDDGGSQRPAKRSRIDAGPPPLGAPGSASAAMPPLMVPTRRAPAAALPVTGFGAGTPAHSFGMPGLAAPTPFARASSSAFVSPFPHVPRAGAAASMTNAAVPMTDVAASAATSASATLSAPDMNPLKRRRTPKVKGLPSSRASDRPSSAQAATATLERAAAAANGPPRGHPTASGRSLAPIAGAPTAAANAGWLAQAVPARPASPGYLVVFGGRTSPGGHLEGMELQGPKISRSSWTTDQDTLSHRLGARLEAAGHHGAPHNKGQHFAEIAHHRQQATGGFTDPLGAVPASVGSNVEDMAFEESHAQIAKDHGRTEVREVNVARVRATGPGAGTLATRQRHLFARASDADPYQRVFAHTQHGDRDIPDKDETRALKAKQTDAVRAFDKAAPRAASAAASSVHAAAASPSSTPAASLRPLSPAAWEISSTLTPQITKYGARTQNDTSRSNYFSGVRSPGLTWRTGSDAHDWVGAFHEAAAKGDPAPAEVASKAFPTGSRNPPFHPPPSPPTIPLLAAPAAARQVTAAAVPPSAGVHATTPAAAASPHTPLRKNTSRKAPGQ